MTGVLFRLVNGLIRSHGILCKMRIQQGCVSDCALSARQVIAGYSPFTSGCPRYYLAVNGL